MKSQEFYPSERNLMGPGPSNIPTRTRLAMAKPTLGHLDPEFVDLMDMIQKDLRYAFQTENKLTFPISAPGSAGMEACFVNLVEPGDKVIVCKNGVFGGRMEDICQRLGAQTIVLEEEWGKAIHPQKLADLLNVHKDCTLIAFVHGETSTGVLSDAQALCKVAQAHSCLTVVDAVTSLAGAPLYVDEWGIDAIYSGSQKCLSCCPGLSPVSFSDRAIDKIKNRKTKVVSWFLDMNLILGYWDAGKSKRSYHHTAPVPSLYALHDSLQILKEEGLENSWQRHRQNQEKLLEGLKTLGMECPVHPQDYLSPLTPVVIPKGKDDQTVRTQLLERFNIEIGAGLGPFAGKVWRIGLMGHSSQEGNISALIAALSSILN